MTCKVNALVHNTSLGDYRLWPLIFIIPVYSDSGQP
jgi:hypothetical protein